MTTIILINSIKLAYTFNHFFSEFLYEKKLNESVQSIKMFSVGPTLFFNNK